MKSKISRKTRETNLKTTQNQIFMKLLVLAIFYFIQVQANKDLLTEAADNKTCLLSQ